MRVGHAPCSLPSPAMMDRPAVEALAVSKRFGDREALCGVDLIARPGRLHGLLGPNGAGKTTLMRVLLGLVRRDAGTVRLLGGDLDSMAGSVPDQRTRHLPEASQKATPKRMPGTAATKASWRSSTVFMKWAWPKMKFVVSGLSMVIVISCISHVALYPIREPASFSLVHEIEELFPTHLYQRFVITCLEVDFRLMQQALIKIGSQAIGSAYRMQRPDIAILEQFSQFVFVGQYQAAPGLVPQF